MELGEGLAKLLKGQSNGPFEAEATEFARGFTYYLDGVKKPSKTFRAAVANLPFTLDQIDGILMDNDRVIWSKDNPNHAALVRAAKQEEDNAGFQVNGANPRHYDTRIFVRAKTIEEAKKLLDYLRQSVTDKVHAASITVRVFVPEANICSDYRFNDPINL